MSQFDNVRFWFQDHVYTYTSRYGRSIIYAITVGAGIILLALASWFGYRWYHNAQNQRAHMVFEQCLAEYQKALFEGSARQEQVAQVCQSAYQTHKNSQYAPYFVILQADLMATQGNTQQAYTLFTNVINDLSVKNPLYYVFKTKYALIMLDLPEKNKQGLALLNELASTSDNICYDMALYYLGAYYWNKQDIAQAQQIWQPLLDNAQDQQKGEMDSLWSMLAISKVQTLKRVALPAPTVATI